MGSGDQPTSWWKVNYNGPHLSWKMPCLSSWDKIYSIHGFVFLLKKLLLILDFTMLPHTALHPTKGLFFLVKDSVSVAQPCIYAGLTMCPIIHKWLAWWKVEMACWSFNCHAHWRPQQFWGTVLQNIVISQTIEQYFVPSFLGWEMKNKKQMVDVRIVEVRMAYLKNFSPSSSWLLTQWVWSLVSKGVLFSQEVMALFSMNWKLRLSPDEIAIPKTEPFGRESKPLTC